MLGPLGFTPIAPVGVQYWMDNQIPRTPTMDESALCDKAALSVPQLQAQITELARIQRLPKAQQRFVMQMIDTLLAQQDR
jgi:hypothetical protein